MSACGLAFQRALASNRHSAFVVGLIIALTPLAGRAAQFKFATQTLTVPENTTLAGENKQTTKLLLGANTDMMVLSGGAQLYRIAPRQQTGAVRGVE